MHLHLHSIVRFDLHDFPSLDIPQIPVAFGIAHVADQVHVTTDLMLVNSLLAFAFAEFIIDDDRPPTFEHHAVGSFY